MSKLAITGADRLIEQLMAEAPQGLEAAAHVSALAESPRGDRLTESWESYRGLRPQAMTSTPPPPKPTPPRPASTPGTAVLTAEDKLVAAALGVSVEDFKRIRMKERLEALEGARDGRKAEKELQA